MRLFRHDQTLGTRIDEQREVRRLFGLFRLVREGGEYPLGYGVAWREFQAYRVWVCPIPLNLIIGGLRWVYWQLVAGFAQHKLEQIAAFEVYRQREAWSDAVRLAQLERNAARAEATLMKTIAEEVKRERNAIYQRVVHLEAENATLLNTPVH